MKTETFDFISFALKKDDEVTPKERHRILASIRNGGSEPKAEAVDPNTLPLIIRRKLAAELIGRSVRAIDYLVRDGLLERKTFKGKKQAAGITRESLLKLLAEGSTALGAPRETRKRKGAARQEVAA